MVHHQLSSVGVFSFESLKQSIDNETGMPNSIVIYGKMACHLINCINHPHLLKYIDIKRRHDTIIVVSSYYKACMLDVRLDCGYAVKYMYQALSAINYLHSKKICVLDITPENLHVDTANNTLHIFNYGANFVTNYGQLTAFYLFCSKTYLFPPELLLMLSSAIDKDNKSLLNDKIKENFNVGFKIDVWMFAMSFVEILTGGNYIPENEYFDMDSQDINLPAAIKKLFSAPDSLKTNKKIFTTILNILNIPIDNYRKKVVAFLDDCLIFDINERPSINSLLKHAIFDKLPKNTAKRSRKLGNDLLTNIVEKDGLLLNLKSTTSVMDIDYAKSKLTKKRSYSMEIKLVSQVFLNRSIDEIYHYYSLSGKNIYQELVKHGLITETFAINNTPLSITYNGNIYDRQDKGSMNNSNLDNLNNFFKLTISDLHEIDFSHIIRVMEEKLNEDDLHQIVDSDNQINFDIARLRHLDIEKRFADVMAMSKQVRLSQIHYQFYNNMFYEKLLMSYPASAGKIRQVAVNHVSCYYRPYVWACLLGINPYFRKKYSILISRDIYSDQKTFKQLELDVRRCHQYSSIMSNPEAHTIAKRILATWSFKSKDKDLVYWQGLDSLLAPFAYLTMNDEALAFASLNSFVKKYCTYFFLQDNSMVMHEYLTLFKQLLTFHDPEVAWHLNEISFQPDLYAIPWFLTMFSHQFPLEKLVILYDTLLTKGSLFPMFVAVAIIIYRREAILESTFSTGIPVFSNLASISIEDIVEYSIRLYAQTKMCCIRRRFGPKHEEYSCRYKENFVHEILPEIDKIRDEVSLRISFNCLIDIIRRNIKVKYPESTRHCTSTNEYFSYFTGKHKDKYELDAVVIDIHKKKDALLKLLPSAVIFKMNENDKSNMFEKLRKFQNKLLVVFGDDIESSANFSQELVFEHFFKHVVVLDCGLGQVEHSNVFPPKPQ